MYTAILNTGALSKVIDDMLPHLPPDLHALVVNDHFLEVSNMLWTSTLCPPVLLTPTFFDGMKLRLTHVYNRRRCSVHRGRYSVPYLNHRTVSSASMSST